MSGASIQVELRKGENAFPGCPACGQECVEYKAEPKQDMAWWRFLCGCELSCEETDVAEPWIEIQKVCPHPTQEAVNRVIFVQDEPAAAST